MKNRLILLLLLLVGFVAQSQTLQRIRLNVEDFYPNFQNPNPVKGIMYMLDDDPTTKFELWSPPIYPVRFTFDVPQYSSCIIKQINTFWETGNPSIYKIFGIRRSDRTPVLLYSYAGNNWNPVMTTNYPLTTVDISGVIIESSGGGDWPKLLELWGTYTTAPPQNFAITHYPIRNMFMINSHVYDYDSAWWYKPGQYEARLKAYLESGLQGGRNYDDAAMNTDEQGRYGFDPTCNGGFSPEIMYRDLKLGNPHWIRHIVFQGPNKPNRQTYWAVGDSSSNLNCPYGSDRSDPNSWAGLGRDGFALGARYGTNKNAGDYVVHPRELWYEKENLMLKGTGLADWLEPWNEDNAWWDSKHCLTTNEMLASMSAFYDGHNGTIPGAGVKNADPNILVSSGGLASADPWFLHEGLDWVIKNRGYRADGTPNWPFDFYQFHAYPSAGDQWSGTPGGLPPEKTLIPWGTTMVTAMQRYAGGRPTGIGELGYDINPNSDINAPTHDGYTAEIVRAQCGVRTAFLASKIGLFFLEWYRLFQDDNFADTEPWTIIFRSMSLLVNREDGKIVRRTITDFFKQLGPWLDHSYVSSLVDNDSTQVHKFSAAGKADMYPAWSVETTGIDPVTGRTKWTERKVKFKFPFNKGTIYTFSLDSSGVMNSTPYNGEEILLTSTPIVFVPDLNTVLPVKLITFTAERSGLAAKLNWKAQDVVSYDVERSIDGTTFTKIASTTATTYLDNSSLRGMVYYRLKMYGSDGKFEYSPVKSVQFPNGKSKFTVQLYTEIGQLIRTDTNVNDIQQYKLKLPRGRYVLRYTDDNIYFFGEKYVKLN